MTADLKTRFKTVDEYLAAQPEHVQHMLGDIRETIKKEVPMAEELIHYNMPAFLYHGMLVWYCAFKKHIGFYPRGSAIEAFKKELSVYNGAKGSLQFPIDKPMPLGLIAKIVRFRAKENLERAGEEG